MSHQRKHENPHQSKESMAGCHLSFNFVCTCFQSGCLRSGYMGFHDSPRRQMIPAYRFPFSRCVNKLRAKQLLTSRSFPLRQLTLKRTQSSAVNTGIIVTSCQINVQRPHRQNTARTTRHFNRMEDRCRVTAGES